AERDRVSSRQREHRNATQRRRLTPTFRSKRDIRRVERRGSQANFRAAIRAQVPPYAVDACLGFARRRFGTRKAVALAGLLGLRGTGFGRAAFDLPHFLAGGIRYGELGHILLSQVGLEIEIYRRAVRWIFSRRWVVLDRS